MDLFNSVVSSCLNQASNNPVITIMNSMGITFLWVCTQTKNILHRMSAINIWYANLMIRQRTFISKICFRLNETKLNFFGKYLEKLCETMNQKRSRPLPYAAVPQDKETKFSPKTRATRFAHQLLEVEKPHDTGKQTTKKAGIHGQSVCRSVLR